MRWPGRVPAGRVVDDFVSHLDFAPNFLKVASASVPAVITGRSLLPILASKSEGRVEGTRDFTVNGLEWHGNLPPVDIAARMIRDDRFQYIVNFSATPRGDPNEDGRKPAAHFETHSQRLDTLPIIREKPNHLRRSEFRKFLIALCGRKPH